MTLTIKTGDWAVFPHGDCDGPLIVTSDGTMETASLENGMVNETGDYVEWAIDGTPVFDGEEYRIIATLPCSPLERIRKLEEALRELNYINENYPIAPGEIWQDRVSNAWHEARRALEAKP